MILARLRELVESVFFSYICCLYPVGEIYENRLITLGKSSGSIESTSRSSTSAGVLVYLFVTAVKFADN